MSARPDLTMGPPRLKAPHRARVSTVSLAAAALITAAALTGCGSGSSTNSAASSSSTSSAASSSSTGSTTSSPTGSASAFTSQALAAITPIMINTPSGKTTVSQPDDITGLNGSILVGFQNQVGTKGEPVPKGSPGAGNLDSTVVDFSSSGSPARQWNVAGHLDGLTADPATGNVVVTTNEDGNAHLFLIDPSSPQAIEYHLPKLPHGGGLDAISIWHGMILISASAPSGTSGPAVYVVSLNSSSNMASVHALFADNATAAGATGSTHLALTDPDSSAVVPASASRFGGQFELTSQGDLLQIFAADTSGKRLSELKLSQSVDDSAWPTSASGTLYVTDSSNDLIWKVTGPFQPGTEIASVTPCNANAAPTTCPSPPKWGPNYLGMVDMSSGAITKLPITGITIVPKGLFFVP